MYVTKQDVHHHLPYVLLDQVTRNNVINIFFEHWQREQEKDIR